MAERRIVARRRLAAAVLATCAWACWQGTALPAQSPAETSPPLETQEESQPTAATRLDKLQEELQTAEAHGDTELQGRLLMRIAGANFRTSKFTEALKAYLSALEAFEKTGDRSSQARVHFDIAMSHKQLGELQDSLASSAQALSLFRELGDRKGQAAVLRHTGSVYSTLGDEQKALDDYSQALTIYRELGMRTREADTLLGIAITDVTLGRVETGVDIYLNQVLPIYQEVGNLEGQAAVFNNLGLAYERQGKLQAALSAYAKASPLYRETGNARGEAMVAVNSGSVYYDLADLAKSLEQHELALKLFEKTADLGGQASTLNDLGQVYGRAGMSDKALEYYNRALLLDRQIGNRISEGKALNNLGTEYSFLGKFQLALDSFSQALEIFEQIGDRYGHAMAMENIGYIYFNENNEKSADDAYRKAFAEASIVASPLLEEGVCHKLMIFDAKAQPALAIYFGKLAVNALQQVRGSLEGMSNDLQDSFLRSKQDVYHVLADLLISQNRLPEAQQVLDLLKKREYLDYVRGEAAKELEPLDLTPAEKLAQEEYQHSTSTIVALGEQWTQLKKMTARSEEQEKQYQDLSDQLDSASKQLNGYYARLYVLFGENTAANKRLADVKGDVSQLKQAIAKQPHTVAIYTLVGSDKTSEIVITGSTVVARQFAISEKELNGRVANLQEALREPTRDPRLVAKNLYDVLIAPIKADLDQASAETLVWSLDGALRYVPLAALYDGKQYLVEHYNVATITPASIAHLADKPNVESLTVAAMGISGKFEANLPPLPAVVNELDEVAKDPKVKDAQGTLPGTILLDSQFTEKAWSGSWRFSVRWFI